MTFTWLNKQGVRSSEGFEVQFTARFTAEYREGRRIEVVAIEPVIIAGRPGVAIDPNTFERWDNSSIHNDAEEQARPCEPARQVIIIFPGDLRGRTRLSSDEECRLSRNWQIRAVEREERARTI